jgi:hypothetical protein
MSKKTKSEYNTAVGLTEFLEHVIDHLIEFDDDPAADIKLLRQAAQACDDYADELEAYLNGDRTSLT